MDIFMKIYQFICAARCPYLSILAAFAICSLRVSAGATNDNKHVPKRPPPEILKAWQDAGADTGWMKDVPPQQMRGYEFWSPFRKDSEPSAIPAFRFHPDKEDALSKLPDPGVAFGLDFHCSQVNASWLKYLRRLKSLRSLNIGGSLVLTNEGLKELAELKSLQGLYLFYAPVTDEGLKELAGLKNLQALDLSHTRMTGSGLKDLAGLKSLQALNLGGTQVTDSGLKQLAGLKSLQWLNLQRTKVTAAGVAGLQKDLPNCKIFARDE